MESRKVKAIDEHGIDRDANIICKFTIDSKDYILYSIERDNENDNLFVSKSVNNNDGTASMVNIEDTAEKNKINDVIKELITYSIDNENSTLDDDVVLSGGEKVKISNVLLNKDQNINVPKTYVTTVKKAVTKVSEDFYKVDVSKKEEAPSNQIFEAMKGDVFAVPAPKTEEAQMPVIEVPKEIEIKSPELPELEPTVSVNETPEVKNDLVKENIPEVPVTNESKAELVQPLLATPKVDVPTVSDSVENPPKVESAEVAPIIPVNNLTSLPKAEENTAKTDVQPTPVVEPLLPVEPKVEEKPAPQPLPPVEPLADTVSQGPKLFFDGSKETNLNMALGEVSQEKTLSTESEGVQALRQFGSDEPVSEPQEEMAPVQENVKKLTRSKGFANNKFFMVIAIAFFVAACIFLGYEAFQYFQIK